MKNNWPVKKLGEVATYFNDGNWIESNDQSSEGIRLIQTGNVGLGFFKDKESKSRFITESTFKRLNCSEIFEGDILISRLPDPVGRACIIPRLETRAITAVDCSILRFSTKLLSKYFLYYATSKRYFDEINKYLTGASRIRISRSNLAKVGVCLPPHSIQKKIVEKLDAIGKTQEFCDQQIQKTDELFESVLYRYFSIAGKKWGTKKLGDVCEIARGGSPRPIDAYLTNSTGGINWIKIGDVKEGEKYIYSTKDKIKPEGASKTRLVKKGDFILSNSMSFGRPYILKISGAIHDGWLLLRLKNNVLLQDYLYYLLGSSLIKIQFERSANGAVVRNLNSDLVKRIIIPIPSIRIQKVIVEKLETVQNYKKLLQKQKILFKELFDSVLDKSMKGEMD